MYHYFDKMTGPFRNLSDLSIEEANKVLQEIARTKPNVQCAKRSADYMQARIYYENSSFIKIPIEEFDLRTISFTYGDSHPTFSDRINDGREYRKKLYTYDEILKVIAKYGLPQEWNDDGKYGPERYIEAHIWSDETIHAYMNRRHRVSLMRRPEVKYRNASIGNIRSVRSLIL